MNEIAEQEDALFAEWEKAHPGAFFRDGVLCPDRYMASKVRVVFVLREANFRDRQTGKIIQKPYNLRDEFNEQDPPNIELPHSFWKQKIAPWCFGIVNSRSFESAKKIQNDRAVCIEHLTRFGFVQLKKTPGSSVIKPAEFVNAVLENDGRTFLNRQFKIYEPDIIIACGIGFPTTFDLLRNHVFAEVRDIPQTAGFQRKCAIVQAGKADGSPTVLIETMHPSHRLKREPVFIQLMSDYRQAVELLRQSQGAKATTN
jgi:hypothetical protein